MTATTLVHTVAILGDRILAEHLAGYLDSHGYVAAVVEPADQRTFHVTITFGLLPATAIPADTRLVHTFDDAEARTEAFLSGYRYAFSDALGLVSDRRTTVNKACRRSSY